MLSLDALGDDADISHNTARDWISVLEASYTIHRLPPRHRNFNERLVKSPKLYFKWRPVSGDEADRSCLVYGGDETQERTNVDFLSWQEV